MQSTDDRIVIFSSKVKSILLIIGALLLVAGGIWLFGVADTQSRYSPTDVKGVAVLATGFFGLCGLYAVRKIFDGSPGLVVDREGIIDNSSGVAASRVPWQDIRDVQVLTVGGQQFLAVVLNNPEKYLGKGNILSRFFVNLNYKAYGTPIFISAQSLKGSFEDVEKHIQDFRKKYGNV